jgi:hypothetical protein
LDKTAITNLINKINGNIDHVSEIEICKLIFNIQNFPEHYGIDFFKNIDLLRNEISQILKATDYNVIFYSNFTHCLFCDKELVKTLDSPLKAKLYNFGKKPQDALIFAKECIECKSIHYMNYGENDSNQKLFNDMVLKDRYIALTKCTIIERLLLDSITSDLLFKHATFKGYVHSYNYLFENNNHNSTRSELNEQRLAQFWYYYKYIGFKLEKNGTLKNSYFPQMQYLREDLFKLRDELLPYFVNKWAGPSHLACEVQTKQTNINKQPCSRTLTIDGIFKVNRLKCIHQEQYMNIPEIGITI